MTLKIADLTLSKALDRAALADVAGGYSEMFRGFPFALSVLSPHIENDIQVNELAQLNQQAIVNGSGVVFNVPIQLAEQTNVS